MKNAIPSLAALLLVPLAALHAADVANLRCEYLKDPLGIDVAQPRLSWVMEERGQETGGRSQKQTAYQVLVASTPWLLAKDQGDLWDSGKVASDQSIQVEFGGKSLPSRTRCHWKVRIWDKDGKASAWSQPALWTMGLLKPEDWQGAQWIGLEPTQSEGEHSRLPARYVRREFEINKPVKSATAYVCGLGEFDLFLNGREVTDRERDPGIMMYNKRLLYVAFDVADYLKHGANGIGVILGNGRYYSPRAKGDRKGGSDLHFGKPRLLLLTHIEYADGTTRQIVSDPNWTITGNGPIRANNEFDGEEYDARMEMPGWSTAGFDDSAWQAAQPVAAPGGKLESFMYEPMRVCETIKPVAITSPDPGVYIVDMGQGFYGAVRLKVTGPAGTRVQMRSSFSVFKDGRFNTLNNRSAKTTDVYILKGRGEEVWYPRFRGQGYRYVEVTGFHGVPTTDNFEGLFIHCNVE